MLGIFNILFWIQCYKMYDLNPFLDETGNILHAEISSIQYLSNSI